MKLSCHAAHADPMRKGNPCAAPLGIIDGEVEFVTTSTARPERDEGHIWLRCPKRACGCWNRFRRISILTPDRTSEAAA